MRGARLASGSPGQMSESTDPYVVQFLKGQPDGPIAFHYPETPAFQAWLAQQGKRP